MAYNLVTIEGLHAELEDLVKQVPSFAASGFSVFDLADLSEKSAMQTFPMAGVSYDGAIPNNPQVNEAHGVASGAGSVKTLSLQFTIIIAVQYHYAGQDNTKVQAMSLLDEVRTLVLGYKGVNSRPWRFIGERPEFLASADGLIFYSQIWQTSITAVGSFNNT